MTLLAPSLAWLAALGLIPIAIWWLNRSRYRIVRWPAVAFLLAGISGSVRRLQHRELILLALRTLALVVAALACARPAIAGGAAGPVQAVIVLDRSLSLAARDGAGRRFDRARIRAQELLATLPRGSAAALVLVSGSTVEVVPTPDQDLARVAALIADTRISDGGSAIAAGLGNALTILERAPGRREIHLVTDLQATGWSGDDAAWRRLATELSKPGAPRLLVADVGGPPPANVQVEALAADEPFLTASAPATFTARIRNRGASPATGVVVELWTDDGEDLRQAASTVIQRLDATAEVHLAARLTPGQHRIQVRLSPDALPADDRRQIVVTVRDRLRVLVAGDTGYIAAALAPQAALAAQGLDDAGSADRFRVDAISADRLIDTDLSPYAAVVLADAAVPPLGFGAALRAWVADGHGLVLLPATRTPWNQVLEPVLPALSGEIHQTETSFASADAQQPVLAYFATPATRGLLERPRFRITQDLTPVATATVEARFADGRPALVGRAIGDGLVLQAAFGTDPTWSDLPLRPAFLILVRRAVEQVALGRGQPSSIAVGAPIRIDLPPRLAQATAEVTTPDAARSALEPVTATDGIAQLLVTATESAGFYRISAGERIWWTAVDPPADESDLAVLPPPRAAERLAPAPVTWIASGDDVAARVDRVRAGREIWPVLVALAIACLALESALIVRWAPREG